MSADSEIDGDGLTGPYHTWSVVERTKALGISSQDDRRKPPPSPKPIMSPRSSVTMGQDGSGARVNGSGSTTPKSKVPPPVVPFSKHKVSKKVDEEHSIFMEPPSPRTLHNPVPSPRTAPPVPRRSLSPEQLAFTTAKSPSPIPYQTPTIPSTSSATPSSYEEPVRDITNRPPMKTPEGEEEDKPSADVPLGIYSEVDTNAIVAIAGLSHDGEQHEYNIATCGRTDPNAPPPLPRNNFDYSSLERTDVKENNVANTTDGARDSHVPQPYEEVVPTPTTNTDSSKPHRDLSKKPPVPSCKPKLAKPPVPSNKPVPSKEALATTPPKPRRTYVTNIAQPQSPNESNPSPQPLPGATSTDEKKSFKPMPLPRNRGSVEIESIGSETENALAKSGSIENTDSPPKEPQDNAKYTPLPYAYVDIDIPDSPRDISNQSAPALATANTEPLPPSTANTSVKNNAVPNRNAKPEGKTTGPPPVGAYRPKRRTPPPPPPGKPASSQVKPVSLQDKLASSQAKPAPPPKLVDVSKGKDVKCVSILPNPTPAKPIQKKFWPFSKKITAAPQPPPSSSKNAGKTPPTNKRRDSVKKILFRNKRQASQDESSMEKAAAMPVITVPVTATNNQSPKTTTDEERADADSPDMVGYDVVGIKNQDGATSKSSPAKFNFQPTSDMTPRSQQRVLAAYAEVDITKKVKKVKERPLSTSYSEEWLDGITTQFSSKDTSMKTRHVISPYGTLPRQKSGTKQSGLPVYAQVDKKPNKKQEEKSANVTKSRPAQKDQGMHIYAEVQEVLREEAAASLSSKKDTVSGRGSYSESSDAEHHPQVPPQTKASLTLAQSISTDEDSNFMIAAYATVDASTVDTSCRFSKEEIASKTRSLGRSLKPKSKPAPLPPQPPAQKKPAALPKAQSMEYSSSKGDNDVKLSAPSETTHKPRRGPVYDTVGSPDSGGKLTLEPPSQPAEPSQPIPVVPMNNKHIPVKRRTSSASVLSGQHSDDSDYYDSTEWESGSEEEEVEEQRSDTKSKRKIYNIVNELLTTERTFVKGLTLLDKEFRQAVLSANRAHDKPIIAEETLNAILSNVGSLCILNSGLLSQLEDRMAKWDSNPRIGDVMLNTAPFFKLYTEYISNFDKALKLLDETCKKNRPFGELVREFEGQPICANLPLSGYLLETVQRIPRYKLLLQDYLKHLPEDSDDREQSEKSLALISNVAAHVNESIRRVDNFKKLIEVQKKLIGDTGNSLISPSRKLLKEGELMKYSRKDIQPRMFFLFTDLLIYAYAIPPANTTYKVIKRIPLHGMKVQDLDDPEVKHGLQLISTSKSFRLGTTNVEEKTKWMKALQDALFEHEAMLQSRERYRAMSIANDLQPSSDGPLGSLAPPWLPDNCVSMCMMCSVRFNLTKRRHHCRACGQIFCGGCSSYLAALKYQDNKMDRVCQTCYETLTRKGSSSGERIAGKKLRQKHVVKKSASKQRSTVLDVKARERNCEISGYLQIKDKGSKWKKQWLEVAEFALFVFEKHEDVSARKSVSLPGYTVIYPMPDIDDKSQLCLTHPGTGPLFFKTENEDVATKWVEVFQNAGKLKTTTDNETIEDND